MVGILKKRNPFRSAVLMSAIFHAAVIAAVLATTVNTAPRLLTGDGEGVLHVSLVSATAAGEERAAPAHERPAKKASPREFRMQAVPAVQEERRETAPREEKRIELVSMGILEFGTPPAKADHAGPAAEKGGSAGGAAGTDGPASRGDGKGEGVTIAVPRYRENAHPNYPEDARLRGYQGLVLLSAEVQSDGRVGEVRIRKSCRHALLDRSALDAVRRWKFEPGRRMGVPVAMWVDVPVRFVLKD
jgi:TonB family protein